MTLLAADAAARISALAVQVLVAVLPESTIAVGPNVQVSLANAHVPHSEVVISADPTDAARLVACGMLWRSTTVTDLTKTVVYVSSDTGRSWRPTLVVDSTGPGGSADPVCAFGQYHTIYFVANNDGVYHRRGDNADYFVGTSPVYRSPDGGATWEHTTDLPLGDRPYLTVDNVSERHLGAVFVGMTPFSVHSLDSTTGQLGLTIYRSVDRGQSFATWATYTEAHSAVFGAGDVLADGRLIEPLRFGLDGPGGSRAPPNHQVRVVVASDSADGEYNAFGANATLVSPAVRCADPTNWPFMPSLAVDHSRGPYHNRAYVVWPDDRSGQCQVLLAWSDDAGATWSPPTVVDIDTSGRRADDFHPIVAVNAAGVVGVSWYDRHERPASLGWQARFAASLDGGVTFVPSVAVSRSRMTVGEGRRVILYPFVGGGGTETYHPGERLEVSLGIGGHPLTGGETAGLTADANGVFHVLWVDNRTGVMQMWTAAVAVHGTATRNGAPELADYDDVSARVTVGFDSVYVDSASQTVLAYAFLRNTSRTAIRGPLKVRVDGLSSGWMPAPRIALADNRESGPGAVWDFASSMPGGTLAPGERSRAKVLHFPLPVSVPLGGPTPVSSSGELDTDVWHLNLLHLRLRVFAAPKTHTAAISP